MTITVSAFITEFESALSALESIIPAIGSFIAAVHPTQGETQRVATAVNVASAALAGIGITASTIQTVLPVVNSVVTANLNTPPTTSATPATAV